MDGVKRWAQLEVGVTISLVQPEVHEVEATRTYADGGQDVHGSGLDFIPPHASQGYNLANGNDDHLLDEGAKQYILETQLNCYDGNKNSTYLTMLACIGLDNITKSLESQDGINQSSDILEVEKQLINTPLRSSAVNFMHLGNRSLSYKHRRIVNDKGKSSLGRT